MSSAPAELDKLYVQERFTGLGIEPLHEVGGLVARIALDLLQQQFLRFVSREARHLLEFVLLT